MKNLIIFGIFILLLVFVQFAQAQTQTVEDVINKYVEVLGGKEKLLSLKTVKWQGNMKYTGCRCKHYHNKITHERHAGGYCRYGYR